MLFNAIEKALSIIMYDIETRLDEEEFDLDNYIDEDLNEAYILDFKFKFENPNEVLLSMKYVDEYCGDEFAHNYDINILEAMFCYVVANNEKDRLQDFINNFTKDKN